MTPTVHPGLCTLCFTTRSCLMTMLLFSRHCNDLGVANAILAIGRWELKVTGSNSAWTPH